MTVETGPLAPVGLDDVVTKPVVRSFTTQLPGDLKALYLSRVWTRRIVTVLGWHGSIQRAVEVVTRLVDNGIRHGIPDNVPPTEQRVSLRAAIDEAGTLIIDVADSNPAFPDFHAAVRGEKGRGLRQVSYFEASITWFLPHEDTGKTVRAVLAPGPVDL